MEIRVASSLVIEHAVHHRRSHYVFQNRHHNLDIPIPKNEGESRLLKTVVKSEISHTPNKSDEAQSTTTSSTTNYN